jgi:hypothetical protein
MGFKTSSLCPVLARGRWRPFVPLMVLQRSPPVAWTVVSESVGSTANPSYLNLPFNLSDHVCGLIRRRLPRSLHMNVAGIPSPHGASPPPAMRVLQTRSAPIHANHPCPYPACWPLSLPSFFTLLVPDSIPQAPHSTPHRQLFFTHEDPSFLPTTPSPSAIFDPPTIRLAPPLKR